MFDTPQIMRMAASMAQHAAARQDVIAANVAHADTPGYSARDLRPFAQSWQAAGHDIMRATRTGHIGGQGAHQSDGALTRAVPDSSPATRNPNGNTVSVEREMMRAVEARHSHEQALGIYATARNILRTSLGR